MYACIVCVVPTGRAQTVISVAEVDESVWASFSQAQR